MSELACLFERHRAVLEGAANKVLRDPDLAKDAIQQALEKLLAAPLPILSDTEIVGWLVGVVRRTSYNLYRQRRRERRLQAPVSAAAGVADPRPTWLDEALARERRGDMDKVRSQVPFVIHRLTEAQWYVLHGIFYRGMSMAELARERGVTRWAIAGRYRAALRRLRKVLGVTV